MSRHWPRTVFNLDPGKLLIVGVVAILVLGPDRLPKVARQVGDLWRSFHAFRQRMEAEVRRTVPDLPSTSEIARLARSPSALFDNLASMAPAGDSGRGVAAGSEIGSAEAATASTISISGDEMSWVTADFSGETTSTVEPPIASVPQRSMGASAVVDANLN